MNDDSLFMQRLPWWQASKWVQTQRDRLYYLLPQDPTIFLNYVWTVDEHDYVTPIKRFPGPETHKYLWKLAQIWHESPLIVVAKSRQMLMTWLFLSLYLWDAAYHTGRRIIFQSLKEEHAKDILLKAKGVLQRIPKSIRPRHHYRGTRLRFYEHDSEIMAVAQGEEQVRSYMASGIFADEAQNQDKFEASYVAAKPTILGGGRYTVIGTAAPGFFEQLWADRLDEA